MIDVTEHFVGVPDANIYESIFGGGCVSGAAPWSWNTWECGNSGWIVSSVELDPGSYPTLLKLTTWVEIAPWDQDTQHNVRVYFDTEEHGWVDCGMDAYIGSSNDHVYIVEININPLWTFKTCPVLVAFGAMYANDATISKVEMDVGFGPGERNRLYRFTGREVISTYTPPPPPPYTPPPPVPTSPPPPPSRPSPPRTPTIPTRPTRPCNSPSPISASTGVAMVPCSDGPMGEPRFSIWQTGPGGNLLRQIQPCQ